VRIRFIPEAEADVMDAYGWYNERGQAGWVLTGEPD
jgi:hypothetical protein